jgi:membrane protease YdiL (CAAX protease family)
MKPLATNSKILTVAEAPARVFIVSLLAFLLCALMVVVAGSGLSASGLVNLPDLASQVTTEGGRQWLRFYLLLSNLIPFAVTALLALVFVFRENWKNAAGLVVSPPESSIAISTVFFVVALPFVGWMAFLNLQIPLPEWMQRNEDNTDLLLKGILNMETVPEFILAFLTVAVTPAIGEELLLRGVVQRRIFKPLFGNHHAAIWLAAILFSAMHLEFAGFAPRFLLGALLGYTYYWTRSLWVPIGLHLLFNGLQVIVAYVTGEFSPEAELAETPPWWLGIGSLVAVLIIGLYAQRKFGEQEPTEQEKGVDQHFIEKS